MMARADKGMGGGVAGNRAGPNGSQSPGAPAGEGLGQNNLASEIMGDAGAQGPSDMKNGEDDKLSNERTAVPDAKQQADANPTESAKMLDKDVRAQAELGKGNRYSDDHDKNDDAQEDGIELSDASGVDSSLLAKDGI